MPTRLEYNRIRLNFIILHDSCILLEFQFQVCIPCAEMAWLEGDAFELKVGCVSDEPAHVADETKNIPLKLIYTAKKTAKSHPKQAQPDLDPTSALQRSSHGVYCTKFPKLPKLHLEDDHYTFTFAYACFDLFFRFLLFSILPFHSYLAFLHSPANPVAGRTRTRGRYSHIRNNE